MKFEDFSGVRVLEWFLERPTARIHFKELCRGLGLSPLTVKAYCDEFIDWKWLAEERRANLRFLFLNNESFV
ncbi:MAG: nucleotidyltransferase domain-containing protein, partial [Candidatus Micrarchaeota archaeon]